MPRYRKKIIDVASAIMLMTLAMLDGILWKNIFSEAVVRAHSGASAPRVYSLPVTHGTSTMLMLPNDVTLLTDAGPDAAIVEDLQKALPSGAPSYIDLAVIASPQEGEYEGYQYLLAHYDVGAFLYNGRADNDHSAEWAQLMNAIAARHIPLVTVGAGDSVHYDGSEIDILAPDVASAHSPDASDTTIVQRVLAPGAGFLLYNK